MASTTTSRWLPVKWRHFRVTSDHLRSRDVVSCHMTSSSCELQPCRTSNAQYTPVFSLLQKLPRDFRSNDVTSGSLPVTWGQVTSFLTTWLPPPASYGLVGSQTHSIRVSSLLQSLPGDFQSNDVTSGSLPVTWGHVTSFSVTWLPSAASYSLVKSQLHSIRQFSAFSHFQVTSGQMTSLPGHYRSPEVTGHHFLSRECLLLRATSL